MNQQATNDTDLSGLKVWLVHDWLTGFRGGEKVLLELVKIFPNSRIATLVHVPGASHPELDQRVAQVSFLNRMPGVAKGWRNYLPLYPRAVRSLHLDAHCDIVISVSHAVAKGVRVPPGIPHLCYCLTPMRYIWGMEDQYLSKWSWKRAALAIVKPYLRSFDRQNAGVTSFMTLSHAVAQRIQRRYNRPAKVAYPGIDHDFYTLPAAVNRTDFYLIVSALVGYKRVDLAIKAFQNFRDRRLVIIGTGPEESRLKSLARRANNIQFLGRQPDDVVRDHYQRCRAFLFPGEEDFGLTVVEAQACGAPVLAYRAGGALETVVDRETGIFFDSQSSNALRAAIETLEQTTIPPSACAANARRFTWQGFRQAIQRAVAAEVGKSAPSAVSR